VNQSSHLVISEIITPHAIELNLPGNSREEVLKKMVQNLPQMSENLECQELLYKALIEREKLHSTGVGDGIALPHSRNVIVGLVDRPCILFARHKKGIPFGAVDGKPAHLFFLLLSPTVTQHLAVLAKISRIVRQPRLRDQLMVVERPEQALDAIREAEKFL